jgi:DNA-binding NarL/FixJ family response regulator
MADDPLLRVVGWGPFRLPGEDFRWAEADARARRELDLLDAATGTAPRPASSRPATGTGTDAPAGAAALDPEAAARELEARLRSLTPDERATLERLAKGHSVSQIAKDLSLSPRTVSVHVYAVHQKTGRSDQPGFATLVGHLRRLDGGD